MFEKKKIKQNKHDSVFNTENMLPISEIIDDVVILKDGGLRAILKVEGLNLDLKNYSDVEIILNQYKKFLNGLQFPLQFVIRNNFLDLSQYLSYIKQKILNITNPILKKWGESYYNFLEGIDMKQGLIYIKEFYIVIPYYVDEDEKTKIKKSWIVKFLDTLSSKQSAEKILDNYRKFVKGKENLSVRVSLIKDGLAGLGIVSERLKTPDIVKLLFNFYNPTVHPNQGKI